MALFNVLIELVEKIIIWPQKRFFHIEVTELTEGKRTETIVVIFHLCFFGVKNLIVFSFEGLCAYVIGG